MAAPATRAQFKTYCLRKLGFPVIDINVDDDQVEDRIDDALQYFQDYHFDGTEKIYMKHRVTAEDIARGWIYVPDAVTFVTRVLPFDDSNSSVNMFDLRYQLRLHDLYDFTSVSYVSYEITMQHIATLNLLFSGQPQFRFNRKQDKMYLDIDWVRDIEEGEYFVIECYRKMAPDTFTARGTANVSSSSNTIVGTGTTFSGDFVEGDYVTINSETRRIVRITSDSAMEIAGPYDASANGQTMTISGNSQVWNDRTLKKYATALIKKQWGENLKKFGGIQMPGGVTLNGKEIWDEAVEEISKIEEDMEIYNVLPPEIMIG